MYWYQSGAYYKLNGATPFFATLSTMQQWCKFARLHRQWCDTLACVKPTVLGPVSLSVVPNQLLFASAAVDARTNQEAQKDVRVFATPLGLDTVGTDSRQLRDSLVFVGVALTGVNYDEKENGTRDLVAVQTSGRVRIKNTGLLGIDQGAVVCWNLSPRDRKAAFETTPIGESYEGGDKRVIGIALERAAPGMYFWILLVQKPQ